MIKLIKTQGNDDISIPKYQTDGSAAFDLHAAVKDKTVIKPGNIMLIPSGISMEFPKGYVAEITPRSGLALKQGISIVNSPAIIDSDFRGEIGIVLVNLGKMDFEISRNDRIAQMNIKKVERADFQLVEKLGSTERGNGSFGSTGK